MIADITDMEKDIPAETDVAEIHDDDDDDTNNNDESSTDPNHNSSNANS